MKDIYIPSLRKIIDNSAKSYGDKPFIKYEKDGEVIEKSYIELKNDTLAVCRYLRSSFEAPKHIAVLGRSSYEYVVYILAVIVSGNVAVPLAPEISAKEAASLVEAADVEIFIHENQFCDRIEELKTLCPSLLKVINIGDDKTFDEITERYSSSSEYASLSEIETDKDACCMIVYTSGTTGIKKGVMLSTKGLIGNIMYNDYWKVLGEGEVTLSVLPIHHVFCFSGDIIRNLKDGLTVCINGDIRNLSKNLLLFEPTVMRVVPMIAQSLLQKVRVIKNKNPDMPLREAAEQVFGKNLKQIISGAAYLSPELVDEYEEMGIYMRQGYGMTEAGCRISVPDENAPRDCIGRVIDICDVRIQNGEIQVNTPSVMMGYYKLPEETEMMFTEDGWLKTGDIGTVTEEGYLYITGRCKNLIILSGGENVSPEAIEKKFADFPVVQEVLVYEENNRICAAIYPDKEYCAQNNITDIEGVIKEKVKALNSVAKPSHIIADVKITDEPLPKTETGKIKRKTTVIGW